jgi:hypothetical protein
VNTHYRELVDRLRNELVDLEHIVDRAQRSWTQAQGASRDQEAYLDSVALNLHSFYSALERLFQLIAKHVDGSFPEGGNWHRDLILQMADDQREARPAVIGHDSASGLDEFRRFRHLVRNVYTINLRPDKISGLMSALPGLWKELRAELQAFADFIEELTEAK